jgi:hypothetical protein
MRLSAIKDDPGYELWASKYVGAKVFLNGAMIADVLTADEELGEVVVHPRNEITGRYMINETNTKIIQKTLTGVVRIELPEEERSLQF